MEKILVFVILATAGICSSQSIESILAKSASDETTGFFCKNQPKTTTTLTHNWPDVFSVAIEAVYYANNSGSRISDVEQCVDKTSSAVCRYEDGVKYQYIFNTAAKTFTFVNDSTTCSDGLAFNPFKTTDLPQNDPLLFPTQWSSSISSIVDVWQWATADKDAKIYKDDDAEGKHDHGIPIDHYYVCKEEGTYMRQIEICVTADNVKMPFPGFNASLPVRIDVKRFKKDDVNATIEEFLGYRLSSYQEISESHRENHFLPPPGVSCNVSKSSTAFPTLPESFSVSVEYLDEANRKIAVNEYHVDAEKHIVSFQYSNYNDTGVPLIGEADVARGKLIHDFQAGLEYIINMETNTCNVTNLPHEAPDAEMDEEKERKMVVRNTSDLLGLHLDYTADSHYVDFYYVGQRSLGDMPADVWLTSKDEIDKSGNQTRTRTIVHEAYFSKPDWTSHTSTMDAPKPILLAVKTYHWPASTEPKGPPTVKTLRFTDFIEYKKDGVKMPWRVFDVYSCLNVSKNDSYLLAIGSESPSKIDEAGRGNVEDAMRETFAKTAGISPLRVTNFYFESVNDSYWVFFFIADRPQVDGTKDTKWYTTPPISAKVARDALNKTFVESGLTIAGKRQDGKDFKFTLNKGSLAAVPPYFATPVIHTDGKSSGYSGGSMAGLGICMLLIGGVLGLVVAFFMWKRNRAGGGAPVYYSNKSSA